MKKDSRKNKELVANSDRRGIQSVDAAMEILNVLMSLRGPAALSAIAKDVGAAVSTTHRYLVSLQRGGLVAQDPATGLYDLGPAALRLGSAAMRRMDALGVAERVAQKLAHETGDTAFVSIWSGRGPMIVRWVHGHEVIVTTAGLGATLPMLGSSAGRIFAAYLPRQLTASLLSKELKAGHYPVTPGRDLPDLLGQIKAAGFAWIDGLIVTGLRGISAPVLNLQGSIEATVTLLSLDPALVMFPNRALDLLKFETAAASERLGYEKGERAAL